MAKNPVIQLHNSSGVPNIQIGVSEFVCIGAVAPFDHPHIYIDMGAATETVCPYCSTLYKFNPRLSAYETIPKDAILGH